MHVRTKGIATTGAFIFAWGVVLNAPCTGGEAWPQFRGPQGTGVVASGRLPVTWGEDRHVAWKTAVAGRGWSSPVGDARELWLTTAVESPATPAQRQRIEAKLVGNPMARQMEIVGAISLRAVGLDAATGKLRHDVELFRVELPDPVHKLNSYASPSPIWDAGRLYCHFGTFGTAAVDTATGKVLWKTTLKTDHSVGPGSSPVLVDGLLIVPCDGTSQQSVVALDVTTGKIRWDTKRPPMTGTVGDLHKAFSTPLVVEHAGQRQVVVPGAQWVVAYDPGTGAEIWRVTYGEGFSNVPRPIAGHGLVYICTGFMRPQLWAIKLGGQGDVTKTHVAWKATRQIPTMPSPVLVGSELYVVSEQGVATCLDALTGETLWQQRLGGNFASSPLATADRIYACSQEGMCTVFRTGRNYEVVAQNALEGQILASPAVIGSDLILRTDKHVYRIHQADAAQ